MLSRGWRPKKLLETWGRLTYPFTCPGKPARRSLEEAIIRTAWRRAPSASLSLIELDPPHREKSIDFLCACFLPPPTTTILKDESIIITIIIIIIASPKQTHPPIHPTSHLRPPPPDPLKREQDESLPPSLPPSLPRHSHLPSFFPELQKIHKSAPVITATTTTTTISASPAGIPLSKNPLRVINTQNQRQRSFSFKTRIKSNRNCDIWLKRPYFLQARAQEVVGANQGAGVGKDRLRKEESGVCEEYDHAGGGWARSGFRLSVGTWMI